jgi:hypothetical protein
MRHLILLSFIVDLYAQVASLSEDAGVRGLVRVLQAAGGILYITRPTAPLWRSGWEWQC